MLALAFPLVAFSLQLSQKGVNGDRVFWPALREMVLGVDELKQAQTVHLLIDRVAKDLNVGPLLLICQGLVSQRLLDPSFLVCQLVNLGPKLYILKV